MLVVSLPHRRALLVASVMKAGSRTRALAVAAALSAAVSALRAQVSTQMSGPAQTAQLLARGHVLTVVSGGSRHRIVLPDSVRVDMDTAEVLDSQHVLSTSYLLLTVRGPSKRNGFGAGQCGAGVETAIVWLELREWRVRRVQSQLVESCWENAMITGALSRKGNALRMTFVQIDARTSDRVLEYDGDRPERGFIVHSSTAHE